MSGSTEIELRLVSESPFTAVYQFTFFQMNLARPEAQDAIAWKLIERPGEGEAHAFGFGPATEVDIMDDYGNFTPRLPARPGQRYAAILNPSGIVFVDGGAAERPDSYTIASELQRGNIDGNVYRSGLLIGQQARIGPGQRGIFRYGFGLHLAVTRGLVEGQVIGKKVTTKAVAEFDLTGIRSADFVVRGGGKPRQKVPFSIALENVLPHDA
ncbi:MAG: hypothetical protein AAGN35_17040 [Bacteroidota bacterium]